MTTGRPSRVRSSRPCARPRPRRRLRPDAAARAGEGSPSGGRVARFVAVGSRRGQGRDGRPPPRPGSRVRTCCRARRRSTPPEGGPRRLRDAGDRGWSARRAECGSRLLRAVARCRPVARRRSLPSAPHRTWASPRRGERRGQKRARACVGRAGGIRSRHGRRSGVPPRRGDLAARGARPRLPALRASPRARSTAFPFRPRS